MLTVLAAVFVPVPAGSSPAVPDGTERWVWLGDDVVVSEVPGAEGGGAESAFRSSSTGSGLGFAVLGPFEWSLPSYTFRLVSSPGIETVRPQAASVAAELTELTGGSFEVEPGTTTDSYPGVGEILIVVSATSPCGSGAWIGCGGPVWGTDTAVAGQVWIHPDAVASSSELLRHVTAHEVGHAIGLAHFDSTYLGQLQVMRSVVGTPFPTFRQGDVNGFRSLHCREDELTDVDRDSPFCSEIIWAVTQGVTDGYPDGSFRATRAVTRQAMAAFLYRFAGSPEGSDPTCTVAPFEDVDVTHPFCGEISWLASTGITTGYDDGTYRPADAINRQAMAAFLYRFAGSSAGADPGCSTRPFSDVLVSHPFCGEISWLGSTGITTGYDDGTFRPRNDVVRQAMVTFLFRHEALGVPVGV